uniref:Uncharacterized protein n=1 Tax=Lactuca sativa TaxID=4236 RepID=A0A9R1WMX9_LACSA|nr:hypothetical protein LSAT_V11C100005250 [Lactuca sativa]
MPVSCCGEETGEEGKSKQRRQSLKRLSVALLVETRVWRGWRFTSSTAALQHRWWRQKADSGGGSKRGEDGGWVNSEWMVAAREKTGEFKMMSGNYTAIDNQNVYGSVPVKLLLLFFNCVFITSILDLNPNLFIDSTLQTFPPSGTQGKISGASGPPRDADGFEDANIDVEKEENI